MNHFVQRLLPYRWLRICACVFLGLCAALGGGYGWIEWHGAHRWEEVESMLRREGETLDFRTNAPDTVPDDQNFCAIPPLKDIALVYSEKNDISALGIKFKRLNEAGLPYDNLDNRTLMGAGVSGGANPGAQAKFKARPPLGRGASMGTATDMNAWADFLRSAEPQIAKARTANPGRDVLEALSGNDGLIHELAQGLSRPGSQWTPAWKIRDVTEDGYPIPISIATIDAIQQLTAMLCLRSTATANAGEAAAFEPLEIAVRMNEAYQTEPFLISTVIAAGADCHISGGVWEVCGARTGSEEDYRALQEALARVDLKAAMLCAERGEAPLAALESAAMTHSPMRVINALGIPKESRLRLLVPLIPDGWIEANEATAAEWNLDYYLKPLRDGGLREALASDTNLAAICAADRSELPKNLDEVIALSMLPNTDVIHRAIYAQDLIDESIAACALERYRMEHGAYPDRLDAANHPGEPAIPLDIISGRPMGYRRTADGRYVIWCVAFNGKDHGGKRVLGGKNREPTDAAYAGDWVWDFSGLPDRSPDTSSEPRRREH